MSDAPDMWSKPARHWNHFLVPMRPPPDDTAVVEREAAALAGSGTLRAAILGVTQETARCAWPQGTRLRGYDSSQEIIGRVWPSEGLPADAEAVCASWDALPIGDGEIDLVAADGSLSCVAYPDGAAAILAEVARVLRPGGRFVVRTFLRPEQPEKLEAILDELYAGRIGNAATLKLRVAATLHEKGVAGFSMHGMWKLWQRLFPDIEATARQLGWPLAGFPMLQSCEETDLIIVYPTLEELRSALAPCFREVGFHQGTYELAERTPTLVLEPR